MLNKVKLTLYTLIGSILMAVFLVNYYITGIPHMVALLYCLFSAHHICENQIAGTVNP